MENCLFCKIIEGQIPAKIVYRDQDVVAFADINPQAPTHVLIVPKKPIVRIAEASSADQATLGQQLLWRNIGRPDLAQPYPLLR